MSQELLRIVDNIARDKNIDRESVFKDLEEAMVSAVRKHFSDHESEILVQIDRRTGHFEVSRAGQPIDIRTLGRIPAQTAKQVMIQKIRADERDSIYSEFVQRRGQIISGSAIRYEGGALVVSLGHSIEGFMPRGEQIMGQTHRPGERVRCLILEVKEVSNQVKIILSRTHPDFIRGLFEAEVPEIAEGVIEIRALAREAGYRTKVAVASLDDKVDPVGACVGVRGSRIKNIVDEVGGEKIDIVRWNESSQVLVANALMPAKVSEIALCFELGKATVVVSEDQLSLAIGKHGQNVRLAARLSGWDIDILTPDVYNSCIDCLASTVKKVEGADEVLVDKLIALGVISVVDLEDVGTEPLIEDLKLGPDLAGRLVAAAVEEAKRLEEAAKQKQVEKALAQQATTDQPSVEPAAAEEAKRLEEAAKQKQAEKALAQQATTDQPSAEP